MPKDSMRCEEKKLMWDGKVYETSGQAQETASTYGAAGFATRVIHEEGKYLVYTRRVASAQPAAQNQ